jgi:hypothetical protein
MNRRDLLSGSLKAVASGSLLSHAMSGILQAQTKSSPSVTAFFPKVPSPRAKLRVKPVMTNMIHSGVWEGPCRFNVVTVQEEKDNVQRTYDSWCEKLRGGAITFGDGAEVLEPSLITFNENFTLPPASLAKLARETRDTDVFFIAPHGTSKAAFDIVHRFQKPGVVSVINCRTVDVAAYAKSQGEEILIANDNDELVRTMDLLRARKHFCETRVLFPTNRGYPSVASLTAVTDLEELQERLGVQVTMLPFKALDEAMAETLADADAQEEALEQAEVLISSAVQTYLDRKYVASSLLFKKTVEQLMASHGCNAFTIECFEFCASLLPQKWTITPCLIHSLFKDNSIASSCEGDLGGLLAMRMLMSLSEKSSHLGNMFLHDGKTMEINHSAAGIKMNGFDQPGLEYKLGRFVESGWGTKVSADFMQNPDKRVTVARMHPNARQVLVMDGQLVGSKGSEDDNLGCSVSAFIVPTESGNAEAFVRRQAEYGNHLVWVYGNYVEEMQQLGDLMGLEVEVIS